jgi:hypothetical protein
MSPICDWFLCHILKTLLYHYVSGVIKATTVNITKIISGLHARQLSQAWDRITNRLNLQCLFITPKKKKGEKQTIHYIALIIGIMYCLVKGASAHEYCG